LGGTEYHFSEFTSPDPKLIIATIAYIFEASNSPIFQRVHFHCLQYHIVALRQTPKESNLWPRSRAAASVCAGSLITTINAGFDGRDDLFDVKETDLLLSDPIEVPVSISVPNDRSCLENTHKLTLEKSGPPLYFVSYSSVEFWIAPVLVCKRPKKTVGLGDAISSTGLAYSL